MKYESHKRVIRRERTIGTVEDCNSTETNSRSVTGCERENKANIQAMKKKLNFLETTKYSFSKLIKSSLPSNYIFNISQINIMDCF